jgi:hypothetical protein
LNSGLTPSNKVRINFRITVKFQQKNMGNTCCSQTSEP